MDALTLVSAVVMSIVTGAVFTYIVSKAARRLGWVLDPASHHIHKRDIPRLGGVAVFGTFVLIFGLGVAAGVDTGWRQQLPVIVPAAMLFLVGLVDDIRALRARTKLTFQILGGAWLFFAHLTVFHSLPLDLHILPTSLGLAVSLTATVAWVVLITNAFNLIDGLDGLAAGATLFSLISLYALAWADHDPGGVFLVLALAGAVLGFLRFNFNPASIFLGDSGSLFLGFMLSGLALRPHPAVAPNLMATAIPLIAFGVPILETGVSVVRRFLGDKPLFAPDQDHFHHRLLKLGLTHRQAVGVLYCACAGCSLLSLYLLHPNRPAAGLVLVVVLVGVLSIAGIQSLGYQEFCELSRLFRRWLEQKKVIANNIAIRNAIQALKDCDSWTEVSSELDAFLKTGEFDCYSLTVMSECTVRRVLREGNIADRTLLDELSEEGIDTPKSAAWSLAVDLPVRGQQPLGNFKIGRVNGPLGLRMDINILLSEMQPVLGQVCDRIRRQEAYHRGLNAISGVLQKPVDAYPIRHAAVLPSLLHAGETGRGETGLAS